MDAQRTPDELSAENALICEKLLGWKQSSILGYWFPSPCHVGTLKTPAFDTWASAGRILEALEIKREPIDVFHEDEDWSAELGVYRCTGRGTTGPLAIRAAALEYIKAVKS